MELLDDAVFLRVLDEAVLAHGMLKHPFYEAWNRGELTRCVLRDYAKQYYHHVKAFPQYVSGVHANCDDLSLRQELLQNLIEEEYGPNNHPCLWRRFAASLGLDTEDLEQAAASPMTETSVNTFRRLTRLGDPLVGLAALYAYEMQIPEVAKTKRLALAAHFGIRDEDAVSFFTVHEQADLVHRKVERDALVKHAKTHEKRSQVLESAQEAAQALWHFLDGVSKTAAPA